MRLNRWTIRPVVFDDFSTANGSLVAFQINMDGIHLPKALNLCMLHQKLSCILGELSWTYKLCLV